MGEMIKNRKPSIKVVKRDELDRRKKAEETNTNSGVPAQDSGRDIVTTVSAWVREFQQKRHDRSESALTGLFGPVPHSGKA